MPDPRAVLQSVGDVERAVDAVGHSSPLTFDVISSRDNRPLRAPLFSRPIRGNGDAIWRTYEGGSVPQR